MPFKEFELENGQKLVITKRRNNRNIKLTIDSVSGKVKISQPYWVPYRAGLEFAKSKAEWIQKQLPKAVIFKDGQLIGKNHRLNIVEVEGRKPTKVSATAITVFVSILNAEPDKQKYVTSELNKHAPKALKEEANKLLPQRLEHISERSNLTFSQLKFKKLKGRWGSCDRQKNITLNIYLIQLPWHLIDYVILHELAHTKHLHHQKDFWDEVTNFMPDAKQRRKEMKNYKPQVFGS